MSTVRIQVRRGTAAQWTAANPVLEAGEMGFESDTKYLKFGDGTTTWTSLAYANDPGIANLTSTLTGYVELTDIGAVSGVAGLDASKNLIVPGASIIVEGATDNAFETTLTVVDPTADRTITFPNATGTVALTSDISALVDSAPGTLDTLNELAAALGDDPNYAVTIANSLNALGTGKQDKVADVSDTEIGYLNGVTSAIQTQLNNKQAVVADVSDTEIGYLNGVTSAIQTQLNNKQAVVADVSDTEIGYLNGVTSGIQTQLNEKQAVIAGVGNTEIGYLAGVTSAIQTQLAQKSTDLGNHASDTTAIHGIADTAELATKTYADGVASTAQTNAQTNAVTTAGIAAASAIATAVTNHENDTTSVHGITDTSLLVTTTGTQTLTNKTITTPAGLVKSDVGLGNVDNTADSAKPVSTSQASAIATAKSEAIADATSQVNALLSGAPAALNTLDELAAALGDDANFAATVTTSLGLKVDSVTPISQKTASYTLSSLTERDDLIEMGSGSALTLTIPPNSAIAYPVGTSLDVLQTGAGQVTIAAGDGVTVNATPGLKLRTQWSSATLFKRAENTWVVFGDLTA